MITKYDFNKKSLTLGARRKPEQVCESRRLYDVYNARMAETYLATANYVWPAAVDTCRHLPLVKT